ncbi:hypothetical protein [Acidovorax sp. sic0104]|uniref:hypothetical protein n=1 Tax=Acidovorax sp. sic0104 TaxID=2854784 RepID=UPI001C455BB5|nr:hypothetical protein [Acidovorax sp. sic0104]MBV7541964.1 hypothetical protein [Acidovorax sp. sic0104]
MPGGSLHSQLVSLGARWLRTNGFSVVAEEITVVGCREQPDVIGFRSTASALIEAKATRGDFLADRCKPERVDGAPGLGLYRFYIAPPGVIEACDLPPRWGLLHAVQGKVVDVVRPQGNLWSPPGEGIGDWPAFQHAACPERERAVLFSIARRLSMAQKGAA